MEENIEDLSNTNETKQPVVDQWKNDVNESTFNNDNFEDVAKMLHNTSMNQNATIEGEQESNSNFTDNTWGHSYDESKSQQNNQRYNKGQGRYHKSNHGNNSFEKPVGYDSTSNNLENNRGHGHGRGRGRGIFKRFNDENESFEGKYNSDANPRGNSSPGYRGRGRSGFNRHNNENECFTDSNSFSYNNHEGNHASGHRGRGRGHYRGRGGRFKENDGFNEDGYKRKENDKSAGSKTEYIPPDIESEESIAGIEAGLNFDKYDTIEVKVSGTDPPKRLTSFTSSGLRSILLENLSIHNFCTPTPIQNYAIPIIMAGRDLMASAQTGSGKTAAFVLPILHNLLSQSLELIFDENHCEPYVVIIAPTRELAVQISECVWKFCKGTNIKNAVVYGGTSIGHQKSKLLERGIHILTATPGRLNDFVQRGFITFSSVKFFVLDEADRMLDMGFKPDIERVLNHSTMTPIDMRQTIMFSATFASDIQHMATYYLKPDYIFVAVGEIGGACKDVVQAVMEVGKFEKKTVLLNLLKEMENCQGTMVFVEQKRTADYVAAYLSELDFPTTSIHGAREQPERELALRDFKTNKMKVLIATAVAARGLDIKGVNNVVNFDMPKTIDEYVHRIGRTGRLGNAGKAISFFDSSSDGHIASELIRILKQAEQEVPQWLYDIAERAKAAPAIDNFNDIRTDVNVTSEFVSTEEEQW